MTRIAMPSSVTLWRTAAVCMLGALIGLIALKPADAGRNKTRVLQPTKVFVKEGHLAGGNGTDSETVSRCPQGWQVTGGGVDFVAQDPSDVAIVWNGPLTRNDNLVAASPGKNPAGRAWRVRLENTAPGGYDYSVGAICTNPVRVVN